MEIKYLYIFCFFILQILGRTQSPLFGRRHPAGYRNGGKKTKKINTPNRGINLHWFAFSRRKKFIILREREREREGSVGYDCYYFYVQKRPQGGLLFCCFSGIFLLTGKLEGRCLNCHALIDSFLIIFLALQHLRLRNVYPFFSFPTLRRVTVNIRTFSRFDAETKSFSIK